MCKGTKKKKSAESSKQDDCYLVLLLKVQCGSNHFWSFWKALSFDYRPNGTRIIFKSKNVCSLLKKKDWCRYFDSNWKIVAEWTLSPYNKFCKVIKLEQK